MTFRMKPRTIKFHKRNKATGKYQSPRILMNKALTAERPDLAKRLGL